MKTSYTLHKHKDLKLHFITPFNNVFDLEKNKLIYMVPHDDFFCVSTVYSKLDSFIINIYFHDKFITTLFTVHIVLLQLCRE